MLSKNNIKRINSLQIKKFRDQEKCFIAEGDRLVCDVLASDFEIISLFATSQWIEQHEALLTKIPFELISDEQLSALSALSTPQQVLCVVKKKEFTLDIDSLSTSLILALDRIQDPGNMGTILRLVDWFGIDYVLCSPGCVDVYNPKVVQASMGSICRTKFVSCDIKEVTTTLKRYTNYPVYGTYLDGESIYDTSLSKHGLIIMGNEGSGIDAQLEPFVNTKLFIPSFNTTSDIDSLNVSIATAIILSEFKRW